MIKFLQGFINLSGIAFIVLSIVFLFNEMGYGKTLLFLILLITGISFFTTRYESFDN